MAPSSITIKLDFGADAGGNSVTLDGGVPTPFSPGALSASAHGQSTEALPTPFSGAAHSLGQAESAAPVPSLGLAPAGSTVWAHNVSQQGDVPTPMDNPAHMIGVDGGPAPDPHMAGSASADPSAPEPSQDDDGVGEQH